ncbi:peptidoglycan-binding protein [Nonomuraea sp. NPDC051941]|uniref:peptidoglycan-binding protein n=1 Tax=Nonomuraea sp. NPDC051941 TaxID=3364373 RepID=UPI0037CC74E2
MSRQTPQSSRTRQVRFRRKGRQIGGQIAPRAARAHHAQHRVNVLCRSRPKEAPASTSTPASEERERLRLVADAHLNQGQGHDEGCRVEAWQALLDELGYDVDVDGLYDPGSTTATKKSQTKAKVLVTGTVDKTTWQAGRKAAAVK